MRLGPQGGIVLFLAICLLELALAQEQVVNTQFGNIFGVVSSNARSFLGIPFAQPPVGSLRWAPTMRWNDNYSIGLDATKQGNACPQPSDFAPFNVSGQAQSEDCLHLNVFTPRLSSIPPGGLPVIVYIYGGGFIAGSASQPLYDGVNLASSQNVIVVTVNYRLGALGYLALPLLSVNGTGNYGFLDVIEALRWIRSNIAAFGGSMGRISVVGEGSGATLACLLQVSPLSAGLFHSVIQQSGVCRAVTLEEAYQTGQQLVRRVGCDTATDVLACLRQVSHAVLVSTMPGELLAMPPATPTWHPVIDGVALTQDPILSVYKNAWSNAVPFVGGTDANELSLFVFHALPQPLSVQAFTSYVQQFPLFHNDTGLIQRALELYPADPGDGRHALAAMLSDALIVCPMQEQAKRVADNGISSFLYRFAHFTACNIFPSYYGVTQTAELPYLFGHPYANCMFTVDEMALSTAVEQYWTSFAANFTPVSAGNFQWPRYSSNSPLNLVLSLPITTQRELEDDECEFWEPLLSPLPYELPGWVVPVVATLCSIASVVIIAFIIAKCIERAVQRRNQSMLTQSLLHSHKPYSGWQLKLTRSKSETEIML